MMNEGSRVPFELSRPRKSHWVEAVAPLGSKLVNWPPTRICPFGSRVIASTLPFASGSKPASSDPSELTRAMQLRVVAAAAPLGLRIEKPPPIRT